MARGSVKSISKRETMCLRTNPARHLKEVPGGIRLIKT